MSEILNGKAVATLGGGCFWCLEAVFDDLNGVISVESGYMGGKNPNPTYEDVCGGRTGHAEVVQITFDPAVVSFKEILEVFFVIHDPTTLNRQGNDSGTQYRSAIFYHSPGQKAEAEQVIANLSAAKAVARPGGHRSDPGDGVLHRGGIPSGILRAQSGRGVLLVCGGAQGGEVSQALPVKAEKAGLMS